MANLRFTREHEWIRIDGDVGTIGISDYAQQQLGDVVFVELPAVGREVQAGGEAAVVESVKAASEVYSPASGEVIEVNEGLQDEPAKVNADAGGAQRAEVGAHLRTPHEAEDEVYLELGGIQTECEFAHVLARATGGGFEGDRYLQSLRHVLLTSTPGGPSAVPC